jgi:N-acetylglucosaminyldiphosphoundecaprenol N-acetyl-beta-D-mannosaminyltransferase
MKKSDLAGMLLHVKLNTAGKEETFRTLSRTILGKNGSTVITPNIHHLAVLRTNPHLREAYSNASFILADGWPVALLASIKARRVVARQTGSDLIANLTRYNPSKEFTVALLGGFGDAVVFASENLERRFPKLKVVYVNECPTDQIEDLVFIQNLRADLFSSSPDLVILGLGCPKQELFSNAFLSDLPIGLICNLGATIDFFSGAHKRAPIVVRLIGLEWFFRLLNEPRRLFGRYALGVRHFPYYLFRFITLSFFSRKGTN